MITLPIDTVRGSRGLFASGPFLPSRAILPAVILMATLLFFGLTRAVRADPIDDARREILSLEDRRSSEDALHGFLRAEAPEIRARAALAVGRIGEAGDVPRLAPLLRDPQVEVRRMAAFALGEIEDSTAAITLEHLILSEDEPDAEVRALAVEGLGKLRRGTDGCRLALADFDPLVQRAALLAAWRIPVRDVAVEITQLARHKRAEVRYAAVYCLMRLLGAPASGRTPIPGGVELSDEERDLVARELLHSRTDGDLEVRMQALRGLRSVAGVEGEDLMAGLWESLGHDDWRVRVEALQALAATPEVDGTPQPRAISAADIAAHLDDRNANVRATVLALLGRVGDAAEARAALETQFANADPGHRQAALSSWLARFPQTSLTGADSTAVVTVLERCLGDDSWNVRAVAIEAAALLRAETALPFLERLSRDDARVAKLAVGPYLRSVRDAASERGEQPPAGAGAAGEPAQSEGVFAGCGPELERLLSAEDPMVRLMTLDAMRELVAADSTAGAQDFAILEAALTGAWGRASAPGDTDVRQQVVDIAGGFADRPAMQAMLHEGLSDPSFVVRRAAYLALVAADLVPGRRPEPVETLHRPADYRAILEWANADHWAVITTAGREIVVRLFTRDAPLTCWNFAQLAGSGFYDGGNWHRVVPNFVVQDGCPRGDGWGGPDHQIRCEINRHRYTRGALGMALSGKDTGGSQFFLTHSAQPHLDGGYTVFGTVERGMEVADQVAQLQGITSIRVVDLAP